MKRLFFMLILFGLCSNPLWAQSTQLDRIKEGSWKAWLDSPGGKLAFELDVQWSDQKPRIWIVNGMERVEIPQVRLEGDEIILEFVHYNSRITATINSTGNGLVGQWKKVQGLEKWTEMDFEATFVPPRREVSDNGMARDESLRIQGRWLVQFSSSDDPAIGEFVALDDGRVAGTFMTTTGDYRFLGGTFSNRTLELSVFDGAHAFVFLANLQSDGTLKGDFWSRDAWHETWTATRDPEASLPDGFTQTAWNDDIALKDLKFRALDGALISPADDKFKGKCRIIEVFGTWCPNCNDATKYMVELDSKYRDRGLAILGLAFEMTGDAKRDGAQVQRYIKYHDIEYPILVAGISDKAEATKAFPVLDRVRSYPTFIFLDALDNVKAIYTGFNGPATGAAYDKLREDFERIIEQTLGE